MQSAPVTNDLTIHCHKPCLPEVVWSSKNVLGTKRILSSVSNHNAPTAIHASSSTVTVANYNEALKVAHYISQQTSSSIDVSLLPFVGQPTYQSFEQWVIDQD